VQNILLHDEMSVYNAMKHAIYFVFKIL